MPNYTATTLSPLASSPNPNARNVAHLSPKIPTSPERNYAFLSSPPESRQLASFAAPPSPKPLKLGSSISSQRRRPVSAQATEIRPGTDWGFLMSGPPKGFQKHVVQRPWPEYVPESSAPVGRTWSTCTRAPSKRPRAWPSNSRPSQTLHPCVLLLTRFSRARAQSACPTCTKTARARAGWATCARARMRRAYVALGVAALVCVCVQHTSPNQRTIKRSMTTGRATTQSVKEEDNGNNIHHALCACARRRCVIVGKRVW